MRLDKMSKPDKIKKMKLKTQIEAYKSVRKPATPPTRVIQPAKGGGYRRPINGKETADE